MSDHAALPPPDLGTPEGKAAYRRELKAVARVPRVTGFLLILVGALLMIVRKAGYLGGNPAEPDWISLLTLGAGWVFLVLAFLQRNKHHRRRMSEI